VLHVNRLVAARRVRFKGIPANRLEK